RTPQLHGIYWLDVAAAGPRRRFFPVLGWRGSLRWGKWRHLAAFRQTIGRFSETKQFRRIISMS
ncbi:MAG: hypothetical protein O6934_12005, partial [SAR324 cluster bacterium]|nr:hypothetical protein [SAR324 cluster bacterium]